MPISIEWFYFNVSEIDNIFDPNKLRNSLYKFLRIEINFLAIAIRLIVFNLFCMEARFYNLRNLVKSSEPFGFVLKCFGVLRVAFVRLIFGKEKLAANTLCQYFAILRP